MVTAKKLIEENNQKRELLTEENEAYCSDMMLYIRLQFSLSEQQSEETLIEMLDHLLDGQAEGKTARDIFGDDPKGCADEIIQQLPKEKKRKIVPFVGGLLLNLISWVLIIRGVVALVISQFKPVDTDVYIGTALICSILLIAFISLNIWFIFRMIQSSLFIENKKGKKAELKVGLVAAGSMAIFILGPRFLPDFGPDFEFPAWISLVIGLVLWIAKFLYKKISERKMVEV